MQIKNSEYRETLEGQLEELESMSESHYSMYADMKSFSGEGNIRMENIATLYEKLRREYNQLLTTE